MLLFVYCSFAAGLLHAQIVVYKVQSPTGSMCVCVYKLIHTPYKLIRAPYKLISGSDGGSGSDGA